MLRIMAFRQHRSRRGLLFILSVSNHRRDQQKILRIFLLNVVEITIESMFRYASESGRLALALTTTTIATTTTTKEPAVLAVW